MRRLLLIIFCFFLSGSIVHGQLNKVEFFKVGVEQGLMQANVYSIVQDNYGIIWIGTQDGMIRYSGTEFTEFLHNPEEISTIANNGASYILVHDNNDLYIATWGGGMNRLDRTNDSISAFYPKANNDQLIKSRRIQCLASENMNSIWVGTSGTGIYLFKTNTSTFDDDFLQHSALVKLKNKRIWALQKDRAGKLWIGTQEGLFTFNRATNELKQIHLASEPSSFENTKIIRAIYATSDGKLWIGTMQGFFILDPVTYSSRHVLLNKTDKNNPRANTINCFLELPDYSVLVGTDGEGIFRVTKSCNILDHFKSDPLDQASLSANDVRCLFRDKSGLIWIGTRSGGINTTRMQPQRFISCTSEPSRLISLLSKNVRCMLTDSRGGIYIGSNDQGMQYISPNFKGIRQLYFSEHSRNSTHSRILALAEAPDKTVWLATDYGIHFIKNSDAMIKDMQFPKGKNFPDIPGNIRSLCLPDEAHILVGTRGSGLYEFNRTTNKWTQYNHLTPGFGGEEIFAIKKISNKVLLGTNSGLTYYDLKTNTFHTYGMNSGMKVHLNDNQIWCIESSRDGMIWLGTANSLISFDPKNGKFEKFSVENGFESNVIYGIMEDRKGDLWLSGTKGLIRFTPSNHKVKNYNEKDGLPWNVFNPAAYCKLDDTSFAFGGVNGMIYFNPTKIVDNAYIPVPIVNRFDIYVDGKILHKISASAPVTSTAIIVLNANQNVFRVGFSNSNYLFSSRNHFAYMMEGVDYDWQITPQENSVAYSGLNPGTYRLRVKTANNDNVWSDTETEIIITIEPPYYATWWFRLIAVMLIVSGIIFYVRFRIRNLGIMQERLRILVDQKTADLKATSQELQTANASKDRFFSIIAHDLRSPFQALISFSNILNNDFEQLAESEKKSLSTKIESVSRSTYTMLENLLQWSYSQTKKLKNSPENINVADMLLPVLSLSVQAAKLKNISLHSDISGELVVYADPNMMATLFRNLLSNAVKFTDEGGVIQVNAKKEDYKVRIQVIDNGVGMDQETLDDLFKIDRNISTNGTKGERGSGLGLMLCYEFIQMNNGELLVESKPGNGTTFTVILPGPQNI